MKLAYLAFNKNALKAHHVLEQYFETIDTYLYNNSDEFVDYDLLSLPIMVENVLIPSNSELQTIRHKQILQNIKNEFQFLKKNLLLGHSQISEEFAGAGRSTKNYYNLSDVNEIKFDKILNKHCILSLDGKKKEYDFLIVEANEFIGSILFEKNQNILSKISRQSHIVLNIGFELKSKTSKHYLHHEFIYIENIAMNTIFDNWFMCSIMHNKLLVSLLIPYEKYNSEDFIKFIVERVKTRMQEVFDAFEIGDIVSSDIATCDGFFTKKLNLVHKKNSAALPSFSYWSQNKVNDYIYNMFILKNKINRNLFEEKGNI